MSITRKDLRGTCIELYISSIATIGARDVRVDDIAYDAAVPDTPLYLVRFNLDI